MIKARFGNWEQERWKKNYKNLNISNSIAVIQFRFYVDYYASLIGPRRFLIMVQSLVLNIITLSFQTKFEQVEKKQMKHCYNHS